MTIIAVVLAVVAASVAFAVVLSRFTGASHRDHPGGARGRSTGGIHVSGTRVVEADGRPLLIRGTSYGYATYPDETGSFAGIKSLGANAVRVVLSAGRYGAVDAGDVANIIALCRANGLICVLDDHDTTGYAEQGGASRLAQAVRFWIGLKGVLEGEENYVIINIGNEPYGNNKTSAWTDDTINAVKAMRGAGFRHALMVDAPNWGQDFQFVMRDNAPAVAAADPDRNTIFSVHMYGVFSTGGKVASYVSAFKRRGLPLVIGEFAFQHTDGKPDVDAIMAVAGKQGIGYLGWSWSGNGGGLEYLDQVSGFDPNRLTWWGRRLFTGANGIRASARQASVYRGQRPGAGLSAFAHSCTATYSTRSRWSGGFRGEVKVTAGRTAISGWTVTWTAPTGQAVTSSWNASVSNRGSAFTARSLPGSGRLAAGRSTTFGILGTSTGGYRPLSPRCVAN